MSVSWEVHWMSSVLARREVARLAPDILVRTLLIVGGGEFLAMLLFHFLHVRMGLWAALLDVFLLTLVICGPLYWLALRPAARLATRAAAASAEAHFQAVVEAVQDAIVLTEADGSIVFANPAARPIFGFELEELLGHPLTVLLPAWPSPPGSAPSQEKPACPVRKETEGQRRDGSRFPVEVSTRRVNIGGREFRVTVVRDISERKITERELSRLAAFPRLNPQLVLECDAEARITYANPATFRLLQSLGGAMPAARLLPANLQEFVRHLLEHGAEKLELENTVEGRTLLWWLQPLRETSHVRLYARDITERKRAEEELAERTLYLNALIENSPLAVVALDSEHRVRMVNPAFERLFLYGREEVLGRRLDEVISTGETQSEAVSYTQRVGAGETVHAIVRRRRKDGGLVDVELHAVPLLIEGKLVGVYGLYQDITERVRAEAALRESEERFRTLVDTLPVAVRVLQDGKVRFTNPVGAALYGYKQPEELRDKNAFSDVAEQDAPRLREYMEKRAAGEVVPSRYEFRARRRDGAEFPAEAVVTGIAYHGQPATLAVVLDLSERKRLRLFESLLPVCCVCGKVRDDTPTRGGGGAWRPLEEYVVEHSDADLSHTFCPPCYRAYREREGLPPGEPPAS